VTRKQFLEFSTALLRPQAKDARMLMRGVELAVSNLWPKFGTYCAVTSVTAGAPKALELRKGKRGGRGGKGGGQGECM
jgi:hypothetical protein